MVSEFNISSILIANGFGFLLASIMLFGNLLKDINRNRENRIMSIMFGITIFTCLVDPLVYIFDGKPGTLALIIVYAGNFWLFLSDLIMGPLWVEMVIYHIYGKMPKFQKIILVTLVSIGVLFLMINLFYPFVYSIDSSNVYHRGMFYFIYSVFEFMLIFDGIITYYVSRSTGRASKFFPVLQFIIPFLAGMIPQFLFYGVSTIWAGVAISLCGTYNSLKNESLFSDGLTGLYNRYYLDNMKKEMTHKSGSKVTAMMLDLNGFKAINDEFGHSEGDVALVDVAKILLDSVGKAGSVIRYAGDEFVIILKTQSEEVAKQIEGLIHKNTSLYNENSGKEYKISLAIGYCAFDLENQTVDELLKEVDKRMYADKKRHYDNAGTDRRKS